MKLYLNCFKLLKWWMCFSTNTWTHADTYTHSEHVPVRCRGDWAAWGPLTMFASTSGPFSLLLSRSHLLLIFLSSLHFCCSCFISSSPSPSVSLTRSLYLARSSVPLSPLFQHSLVFSPSLKSLAFLPLSLPPFKQQKAISLPLSGRMAVSP